MASNWQEILVIMLWPGMLLEACLLVPNMRISAGLQVGSPAKDKHAYSLGPVATQSGNARF